jgi:2-polyprenyl-6-methoxyphenol hydroxylase-like FAD-dependent oxidoreductase
VKILIIGAGVTGLSCARELHQQGHNITIAESRAEIGHPQDKPGLVIGQIDLSEFSSFIHLSETGCRRPWLAKSMAQNLPITYLLRTDATTISQNFEHVIDTTTQSTTKWEGGVTLAGREIAAEIVAHRSDGTVECWTRSSLPEVEGGWLERFTGTFDEEEASVDASISRGIELASEPKV